MMKLCTGISYLKRIQKLYESCETPFEFCWYHHFFTGDQQNLLSEEIQMEIAFWYVISDSLNFFWFLKDCYKKYGYSYLVMAIVDVFMWPQFGNSSISMKEVILKSTL